MSILNKIKDTILVIISILVYIMLCIVTGIGFFLFIIIDTINRYRNKNYKE